MGSFIPWCIAQWIFYVSTSMRLTSSHTTLRFLGLGMSTKMSRVLTSSCESVLSCGALVNHVYSFLPPRYYAHKLARASRLWWRTEDFEACPACLVHTVVLMTILATRPPLGSPGRRARWAADELRSHFFTFGETAPKTFSVLISSEDIGYPVHLPLTVRRCRELFAPYVELCNIYGISLEVEPDNMGPYFKLQYTHQWPHVGIGPFLNHALCSVQTGPGPMPFLEDELGTSVRLRGLPFGQSTVPCTPEKSVRRAMAYAVNNCVPDVLNKGYLESGFMRYFPYIGRDFEDVLRSCLVRRPVFHSLWRLWVCPDTCGMLSILVSTSPTFQGPVSSSYLSSMEQAAKFIYTRADLPAEHRVLADRNDGDRLASQLVRQHLSRNPATEAEIGAWHAVLHDLDLPPDMMTRLTLKGMPPCLLHYAAIINLTWRDYRTRHPGMSVIQRATPWSRPSQYYMCRCTLAADYSLMDSNVLLGHLINLNHHYNFGPDYRVRMFGFGRPDVGEVGSVEMSHEAYILQVLGGAYPGLLPNYLLRARPVIRDCNPIFDGTLVYFSANAKMVDEFHVDMTTFMHQSGRCRVMHLTSNFASVYYSPHHLVADRDIKSCVGCDDYPLSFGWPAWRRLEEFVLDSATQCFYVHLANIMEEAEHLLGGEDTEPDSD